MECMAVGSISQTDFSAVAGSGYSDEQARHFGPWLHALGAISAREAVDAARPEESPGHRYFLWHDASAGELYRELQAQKLMRSYTIVLKDARGVDRAVRGKQVVPIVLTRPANAPKASADSRKKIYVNSEEVQSDEELSQAVRDSMQARLISARNLLRMYESVFSGERWQRLGAAIDAALEVEEPAGEMAAA